MSWLIFIDTNIWLDFYRVKGRETGLSILDRINNNHDLIISTFQVEIEYKKNRQNEICKSYSRFKAPSTGDWKPPSFLFNSKQFKAIEKKQIETEKHLKALKERLKNAIYNPSRCDPVYMTAQRVFNYNGIYNLKWNNVNRKSIIASAKERHILGHPPRKNSDTSIGDAINWEWIIHCAKESEKNIIIVSRDGDYGISFIDQELLNNWLQQEFKNRVSKRSQITLTKKLTEGLKIADISVTEEEEKIEEELTIKSSDFMPDENRFLTPFRYPSGESEVYNPYAISSEYALSLNPALLRYDFNLFPTSHIPGLDSYASLPGYNFDAPVSNGLVIDYAKLYELVDRGIITEEAYKELLKLGGFSAPENPDDKDEK